MKACESDQPLFAAKLLLTLVGQVLLGDILIMPLLLCLRRGKSFIVLRVVDEFLLSRIMAHGKAPFELLIITAAIDCSRTLAHPRIHRPQKGGQYAGRNSRLFLNRTGALDERGNDAIDLMVGKLFRRTLDFHNRSVSKIVAVKPIGNAIRAVCVA